MHNISNIISIEGGNRIQVRNAIQAWVELYSDSLIEGMQFELYYQEEGTHFLKTDSRLDNLRFFFLVNYLKYPENINYYVNVDGYIIGEKDSYFSGQEIQVYISRYDKEYDNVFVVTKDNRHYKFDFSENITEIKDSQIYLAPNIPDLKSPEIITVEKRKITKKKNDSGSKSISKRFKILSISVLFLIGLNLFLPNITGDTEVLDMTTMILCISYGVWLFSDYEVLRSDKLYLLSMVLSLILVAHGFLLDSLQLGGVLGMIQASTFLPLSLLVVQWPTRKIFKYLLHEEPKVDNHGKISNRIYSVILFVGMIGLSFSLIEYFN